MEVLFDTLLITQDSESVLFYAVAGLYNLSNDASFAQMAARKPGVLAKLHSLNESANPDTVKYATGTVDNWCVPRPSSACVVLPRGTRPLSRGNARALVAGANTTREPGHLSRARHMCCRSWRHVGAACGKS